MAWRTLLLCFAAAVLPHQASAVTPIEKVIELLKKLQTQLEAEGKKEAAEYDKYACFCKEEADNKLYAIEKSEKKIEELQAKEDKLEKDITALNAAVSDLSKKIDGLDEDIKSEKDTRAADFAKYQTNAEDLANAIDACTRAIAALKESKEGIAGNDGKVDLVQLSAKSPLLKAALLAAVAGKQAPPKFEYSSNEILATLEKLLATFKQNKAELDEAEMDARSASEMKVQDLSNQRKFADKEKTEKMETSEALSETLAETQEEKSQETKEKEADDAFMKELTGECETKAAEWDQRSKTRADEITAISNALEDPEKGLLNNADKFKVNTKLNDLQMKNKVAPSFLQLRSPSKTSLLSQTSSSSHMAATQSVLDLLMKKSEKTNSPVLASLSMKLTVMQQSGIDHFVKVRQLIKDLVAKLDADAKAEATTKAYCDENMAKQTALRDEAKLTIEAKAGAILTANANLAQVKIEIAELQAAIAKNMKELKEAGELRAEQKAQNELSIKMSDEGKASIEYALEVLKQFYDNAFLQKETYTPPNADREGKTVGDKAPEVFSGEYHGNQAASKGILGVLEVLHSDFSRTKEQVEKDEQESQSAYEELVTETEKDTEAKQTELGEKETKETQLKDDIIQFTDEKKDAEKALNGDENSGGILGTLEDLKKMCIAGEETYEERRQKRQDEIDALKEAMSILNNWQS